jgi:hypothetical protein
MSESQTRQEFEANLIAKAWKDDALKQELMNNPKAVYKKEIGQEISENIEIRVLEETANTIYLVMPKKPEHSEELSEEQLEAVAGGWLGAVATLGYLGYEVGKEVYKGLKNKK